MVQILHRVGWVAPLTQKGGRVLHGLTLPVRSIIRGVTTPGRAVATTLANRKAEELALEAAAVAAARTWRPFSARSRRRGGAACCQELSLIHISEPTRLV